MFDFFSESPFVNDLNEFFSPVYCQNESRAKECEMMDEDTSNEEGNEW